jgi:hypothetical protein
MPEREIIQPLSADEIKEGLVAKIAEAIFDSMGKTCNLYGCAYPKFKADWSMSFTLDNFGEVRLDRVTGSVESDGEFHDPVNMQISGEIPYTPPNVFRRQTGQPIPVIVEKEDGSMEQKAVFYRRERTSRIGRANTDTDL